MKVLLKSNAKSKEFIEKFEKENFFKYVPTMTELLPSYVQCNDEHEPVLIEVEQYDPKTRGVKMVKVPRTFTQSDINHFRKVGHIIEVIDAAKLLEIAEEKEAFAELLRKARIEGMNEGREQGIKEAENIHKIPEKKRIKDLT